MSAIIETVADLLSLAALATLGIAGILAVLIWKQNLRSRVTYIRIIIQAVALAALFYLHAQSFPLVYFLLVFPITLVLGRLYCGWFCPFGFLQDTVILLKRRFRKPYRLLPVKLNSSLNRLRYVILLVLLLLLPIYLWLSNPPPNLNFASLMFQYLSGPFQSYRFLISPLTPYITPYASPLIVHGINFNYPYIQAIITYINGNIGQVTAIIFVVITLTSFSLVKRPWCRFCPTGSSLGIVNRFKGFKWAPMLYIEKDGEKCNNCGACKEACPMQVNELSEQKSGKINSSMCILCLRCVESCPQPFSLKFKLAKKTLFRSRNSAARIPKWLKKLFLRA